MTSGGVAAGWYQDPDLRYHARWWSGVGWTDHVATGAGERSTDVLSDAKKNSVPSPVASSDAPTHEVAGTSAVGSTAIVAPERTPAVAIPVEKEGPPADWHRDPTGRYEKRYWDGRGWTSHVYRGAEKSSDPITGDYAAPVANQPVVQQLVVAAHPEVAKPAKQRGGCLSRTLSITLGIFLGGALLIGGCSLLVANAFKNAADQLNQEQKTHAITPAQFDSIQLGASQAAVIGALGKQPENAQEFVSKGVLNQNELQSSCLYYNRSDGSFGDRFQFCFDNDALTAKNSY